VARPESPAAGRRVVCPRWQARSTDAPRRTDVQRPDGRPRSPAPRHERHRRSGLSPGCSQGPATAAVPPPLPGRATAQRGAGGDEASPASDSCPPRRLRTSTPPPAPTLASGTAARCPAAAARPSSGRWRLLVVCRRSAKRVVGDNGTMDA